MGHTAENDAPTLPDGVVARIDVTLNGVSVNLRKGMTTHDFAELLRTIADAYDDQTITRVTPPGSDAAPEEKR